MSRPTKRITHDETEHTISFAWGLECKHCGHITRTVSEADRISCGKCNRKNPRDQIIGKYFEEYLKYELFTGEEETLEKVTDTLRARADKYEAMQENGWRFDSTSRSSHVTMSKGDVPQREIKS